MCDYYKEKKFYYFRLFFKELRDLQFQNIIKDKLSITRNIKKNELAIRQYVTNTILGVEFTKQLILSKENFKSIIHPLPYEYLLFLKNKKYKVSFLGSLFLWYLFIIYKFFLSIIFFIKYFVYNILSFNQNSFQNNSIYFVDLSYKNFPQKEFINEKSFNIFEWYCEKHSYSKYIYHNVKEYKKINYDIDTNKILYKNYIPNLNFKKFLLFFVYSIFLIFLSFFKLIVGKWWDALMLKEKLLELIFFYSDKTNLSKKYLFSNSMINYRPLWTYIAETKGVEIVMYYYSSNDQPICPISKTSIHGLDFPNINWPIYYCWDKYQINEIKKIKYSNKSKFFEFGSINFESNPKKLPKLPNIFIAIFDFEPHKIESYVSYQTYNDAGYTFHPYAVKINEKLIIDTIKIAKSMNITVVHKPKRDIGNKRTDAYKKLLIDLNKYDNYIRLDPKFNAYSLISKSKICITQPFTSTALMAKSLNKHSVYYDPLKRISKTDPAKRDIEIIQSSHELKNFIYSALKN